MLQHHQFQQRRHVPHADVGCHHHRDREEDLRPRRASARDVTFAQVIERRQQIPPHEPHARGANAQQNGAEQLARLFAERVEIDRFVEHFDHAQSALDFLLRGGGELGPALAGLFAGQFAAVDQHPAREQSADHCDREQQRGRLNHWRGESHRRVVVTNARHHAERSGAELAKGVQKGRNNSLALLV